MFVLFLIYFSKIDFFNHEAISNSFVFLRLEFISKFSFHLVSSLFHRFPYRFACELFISLVSFILK